MADINLSFEAKNINVDTVIKDINKKVNSIKTEFKFTADITKFNEAIASMEEKVNSLNSRMTSLGGNIGISNGFNLYAQGKLEIEKQIASSQIELNNQQRINKEHDLQIKKQKQENAINNRTISQQNSSMNIAKRLSNYMNKYSTQFNSRDALKSEGNKLLNQFKSGELSNYTGVKQQNMLNDFMATCREVGIETDTLRSKISNLFSEHLSTALVMVGVHTLTQGLQGIYQNIVDIDTQMTELRKVTDETEETYKNFLENSATRAINLGATISDTVKSTADMARLGYNLSDASDLADSALLLKNVGDGITDIDDASEKIISTMKAFNVEAKNSTSIVDEYNEVGNNYSISSAGVAEAMQRSSSALAAANNSMEESIGLTVGANAVVDFVPHLYGNIAG